MQYVDEFNEYSLKNKLNITLNLTLDLPTTEVDYFKSMVESLLLKRSTKYDMYIYDSSYTMKYGEYLLDLNNRIPDAHIKLFYPDVLSGSCMYKNKLVGIVSEIY